MDSHIPNQHTIYQFFFASDLLRRCAPCNFIICSWKD